MKNVLKYEDLLEIEEFLREKEMDSRNLSISMNIETQERLNRINKDYFYKVNKDDNSHPSETDVSCVNVKIGNILFSYKLKERENSDQEK